MLNRPKENEYGTYFAPYVQLVPNGNIVEILSDQINETCKLVENLTEDQANFRYEPGKWNIKEVVGHMADTERYLFYRLFCVSRGEKTKLPGHDQDLFVKEAQFNRFTIDQLLNDFKNVRKSTIDFLKTLREDVWKYWGNANGADLTVRALAYIIAGHEIHHRTLLKERYINASNFPKN
ncbi:DinB family protein [Pallidibacillus pasinlerensis]|uniref:DinB family protein n=1 Tax=Pallidibacillus pasinlerensis TaxID=2703818 RepID=A0ABX0A6W4_9BACI|nr:DinB family protein [Pallidibacillus pasinlerensis]NCU17774.1 DinB family protein [Pallidibacillus pasinlerensis]